MTVLIELGMGLLLVTMVVAAFAQVANGITTRRRARRGEEAPDRAGRRAA